MNSRFRNVCKAHDHIVKCRTKEGKRITNELKEWEITKSES